MTRWRLTLREISIMEDRVEAESSFVPGESIHARGHESRGSDIRAYGSAKANENSMMKCNLHAALQRSPI